MYKASNNKIDLRKGNSHDLVNRFIKNMNGFNVCKQHVQTVCTSNRKGLNPNLSTCKLEQKNIKHCLIRKCIELQVFSVKNKDKLWKQWFTSIHKKTAYMYTSLAHAHMHKTCLFIHKQDWKLKEASLSQNLKVLTFQKIA